MAERYVFIVWGARRLQTIAAAKQQSRASDTGNGDKIPQLEQNVPNLRNADW